MLPQEKWAADPTCQQLASIATTTLVASLHASVCAEGQRRGGTALYSCSLLSMTKKVHKNQIWKTFPNLGQRTWHKSQRAIETLGITQMSLPHLSIQKHDFQLFCWVLMSSSIFLCGLEVCLFENVVELVSTYLFILRKESKSKILIEVFWLGRAV